MKNKLAVWMIAGTLIAPAGLLWASAGDAAAQGPTGTTTGTPAAVSTPKKHHGGHHHKKSAGATAAATSSTPATK